MTDLNSIVERLLKVAAGPLWTKEEQKKFQELRKKHEQSRKTQVDLDAGDKAKRLPETMKMKKALVSRLAESQKLSYDLPSKCQRFPSRGGVSKKPHCCAPSPYAGT